ncbi:hypothetical protein Tco_0210823 [Tanacetum coccineum]
MKRGFRGAPRPLLPSMLLVATNPNAGQEHDVVAPSQPSSSTPTVPSQPPIPTPIPDTEPQPFEHIYEEPSPVHHHFSPPQEQAPSQMPMDDLLHEVPKLISRIDSLEMDLKQTKLTMGNAIVKLVKIGEEDGKVKGFSERNSGRHKVYTLEAAKTLSKVASLKTRSIDKGRRYKRRKEDKGKKVVSSLDFQEEVDAGAEQVNTAYIRRDTLQKEEVAKQVHLDSLLAQRIAEEEELNEQQKKRKAQVQFEAQHYTNEDWDLIRAKLEANAELSKSMLGSELQGEDFAKKMVDLNQGTWKLSQLKSLSFEEIKKEFDKLVKQVESFAPINFEATKASLKRFGEELQTKTPKRLKDDEDVEAKDDEPTKKSGKRRKQMARKGLHTSVDKDDSEGSDEDSEQDDSVTGTKTPINPVPVAMKTPSIATYKIIKQGEKGAYQIVREDGTDVVYINFGAMLKVISRDDLTELYRIVMNRYGMDGPEDELEKVFWKYLKNMFEEPLSTDPIWSELGQQRIISWRYYESCRVHCLNLESMDIYMLIERTYPLSAEMCKAMLDKKLQGGKPDENCYKMLKMMEKQAGIRK